MQFPVKKKIYTELQYIKAVELTDDARKIKFILLPSSFTFSNKDTKWRRALLRAAARELSSL